MLIRVVKYFNLSRVNMDGVTFDRTALNIYSDQLPGSVLLSPANLLSSCWKDQLLVWCPLPVVATIEEQLYIDRLET